jgi:AcrR family transcriptional regulator
MAQHAGGAPTRGRGRPPRLSRDQIVEAAVALAYDEPAAPLTIKRVSAAVHSAPMALYRYFPDRDDLLHAVADRVANDMRFDPPKGATWQDKLRAWMLSSLEHLRPYPQLLPYIASTRQPSWLPSFIMLTDVLSPLDLNDEDMALAIALIGTTVVGQSILAAQRTPVDEMVPLMRQALTGADADDRARVEPVLTQLPGAFDRLYDVVIDNTVTALESLSGHTPTRGRRKAIRKTPLAPIFSSAGTA